MWLRFSLSFIQSSMTSLLKHSVAHSSSLFFRPKTNNQLIKKFLSKSCQKMDVIFENKVVQKLKFSKNVNIKKYAPKLIFFNEKKIRKIQIIFVIENWLWKSEFFHFWQLLLSWLQHSKGLVINFWPKGRPGRMCDSVR